MKREFLETFRKPSARVLAQRELEDAERQLLSAESARDYAARMAEYHKDRIYRLSEYLRPKQ